MKALAGDWPADAGRPHAAASVGFPMAHAPGGVTEGAAGAGVILAGVAAEGVSQFGGVAV